MQDIYKLEDVAHTYPGNITALSRVSINIQSGEQIAIIGANGSGKSTLLKVLDGLVFPTHGRITAYGQSLTEDALDSPEFRSRFRSHIGFVFQDADVQLFCSTVFDDLTFGPLQLGLSAKEVQRRVTEVARQLQIEALLDRAPYGLSGGEKKRAAIASVLTIQPEVLLLDEPTSALDPRSQVWLLNLMLDLKQEGKTVVIATHDLSIAQDFADRVIVLSEAHEVVADGPPEEILIDRQLLLSANLLHEHTHRHGRVIHIHGHGHATGLAHWHD